MRSAYRKTRYAERAIRLIYEGNTFMIQVFNKEIPNGSKAFFTVDGPDLANKAVVKIPVIVLCGEKAGPTLWINGAVHGDELNGSVAAWQMVRELDPAEVKGTIVVTPIANTLAFMDFHTISHIDDRNMDQIFPGDATGDFTQRTAKLLYDEIRAHADMLISFHTMNKTHEAHIYTVTHAVPGVDPALNKRSQELALAFGAKTNCVVDLTTAKGELPGATSGALDITCIKDGIPAFMAEVNHGCDANETDIADAIVGMKNVMKLSGMMDGEIVQKYKDRYRILDRRFLRAPEGGMWKAAVTPGQIYQAGSSFGQIHYFGEEIKPVVIQEDFYVIGIKKYPAVQSGDRIGFIGTKWEKI